MKLCLITVSSMMLAACGGGAISTSVEPVDVKEAGAPYLPYLGCTDDTDCSTDGTVCGTSVCSWANDKVHVCVPAGTNYGWCGDDIFLLVQGKALDQARADQTCKCFAQGATCNMNTNFCSFTQAP